MGRWQFRISTLFLLVLVCAVGMGWYCDHRRLHERLEAAELLWKAQSVARKWEGRRRIGRQIETNGHSIYSHEPLKDHILKWEEPNCRPLRSDGFRERFDTDIAVPKEGAVLAACAILADANHPNRCNALALLRVFGEHAAEAVPTLICALDDSYGYVREQAAYTLGRVGSPGAATALPALVRRIDDNDPRVREAAMSAVATILPPDEEITVIGQAFRTEADESTRGYAGTILRDLADERSVAGASLP